MSTIILPNDAEVREALGRPSTWPEASIVGQHTRRPRSGTFTAVKVGEAWA